MSIAPRRGSATSSLSVMMFLQYAVWGVWLPYLANYLQQPTEVQAVARAVADVDQLGAWMDTVQASPEQQAAFDLVRQAAAAVATAGEDPAVLSDALDQVADRLSAMAPPPATGDADAATPTSEVATEAARRAADLGKQASNLEHANHGLGFTGGQIGWILGLAGSIGALFAPFVAGQVADRFLNAEKALGLLLIGGGIVKFATAYATDYSSFMALSIVYSILYMPTLALTNSVAFANLDDAEKSFPRVRTWGTIGWIVASNAFPLIWLQTQLRGTALPPFLTGEAKPNDVALIVDCLKVSGAMAVAYGFWAMLALPKTPPKKDVENPLAFLKAFGLLRHPGFLVVTLAALPIAMIHQVYFIRTGPYLGSIGIEAAKIGPMMSIGQFSEIAFLAILGFFLKNLGYRLVLTLGCAAYAVRFGLFSIATEATSQSAMLAALAMVLHGLCYGFFFAGAYVYIERLAPADIRHSVQTVFGIIILGLGPVLAGFYNQELDVFTPAGEAANYAGIWRVQALIGLVSAVAVALAFRPGLPPSDEGVEPAAHEVPEAGGAPPMD